MNNDALYRGCFSSSLILILLTTFCIVNVEAGSSAFYLCVFSYMINIPFILFILFKLIRAGKTHQKVDKEIDMIKKWSKKTGK